MSSSSATVIPSRVRWRPTERDIIELVASGRSRLIRGEDADPAEYQPTSAAFACAVLYEIAGCAARLHANTKALDRSVASVPHEGVSAGGIGADGIDDALGQLGHDRPCNLLIQNLGKRGGSSA